MEFLYPHYNAAGGDFFLKQMVLRSELSLVRGQPQTVPVAQQVRQGFADRTDIPDTETISGADPFAGPTLERVQTSYPVSGFCDPEECPIEIG